MNGLNNENRVLLSPSYTLDSLTPCFDFYVEGLGFGRLEGIYSFYDPTEYRETNIRLLDADPLSVMTTHQEFFTPEEACAVIRSAIKARQSGTLVEIC